MHPPFPTPFASKEKRTLQFKLYVILGLWNGLVLKLHVVLRETKKPLYSDDCITHNHFCSYVTPRALVSCVEYAIA